MKRIFWLLLGFAMVGLGIIGALLPVMPTTIFLILAVGCFARSSPRLEAKLLEHHRYGPALRAWSEEGAISLRGKRFATGGIALGMACFLIGARPSWALGLPVFLAMALCALWIITRPLPRAEQQRTGLDHGEFGPQLVAIVLSLGGHALALWLVLGHWHAPPRPPDVEQVRIQLTFLTPSAPPVPVAATVSPQQSPDQSSPKTPARSKQASAKARSASAAELVLSPAPVGEAADVAEQPRSADAHTAPSRSSAPEAISLPPSPQMAGEIDPNWEGEVLARLERFKRYPRPARVRRQEGIVLIHAVIDRAGRVLSAEVEAGSGSALLDREALETFSRAQPLPPPPPAMAAPAELNVPVKFFLR